MNIILLPVLLLVFLGAAFLLVKGLIPKLNRFITWRNNLIFAGIYLGLLLLLFPVASFLLRDGFHQSNSDIKNLLAVKAPKDWTASPDTYHLSKEEVSDRISEMHQSSSQKFKVNTNRLIIADSDDLRNLQIFIKRKDIDDGEIEVGTYISPQYAGNIDFTQLVLPPKISLENGNMRIELQSQEKLEFKRFNADFTINQFKPDNWDTREMNTVRYGSRVVYIHIPKSMEIVNNGPEFLVQMVD
jgi:hypothetical protein